MSSSTNTHIKVIKSPSCWWSHHGDQSSAGRQHIDSRSVVPAEGLLRVTLQPMMPGAKPDNCQPLYLTSAAKKQLTLNKATFASVGKWSSTLPKRDCSLSRSLSILNWRYSYSNCFAEFNHKPSKPDRQSFWLEHWLLLDRCDLF